MKNILFTFATFLCLAGLCSCGGEDNNGNTGGGLDVSTLKISPLSQTVANKATTVTLQITCDKVPSVSSDATWCSVGGRVASNTGYDVTINVAANDQSEDRTANITVTVGSASQKATITQSAKDALLLAATKGSISDDGGELIVELKANGNITVKSEVDWISNAGTRAGMADYKYALKVAANQGEERKGSVVFSLGDVTEKYTVTQAKGSQRLIIDLSASYQTIEGFAASDCWAPAEIGKYWTNKRDRISELLFSKEIDNGQPKGIGLSMWRSNLGAGSAEQGLNSKIGVDNGKDAYEYYRRAESYLNNDLSYDWTRCEGQRYFLDRAKELGVESIVLFSNAPNVQFSKNGLGTNLGNGFKTNLKDECYDDFAQYMAKVAKQYQAWGYPVTHISPVNEPQYDWGGTAQEGCSWSNAEIAKLAKELDKALEAEGVDAKILLAEASSWDCAYQKVNAGNVNPNSSNSIEALFSPSSDYYVGDLAHVAKVFGAHSYWTDGTWYNLNNTRQKAADKAAANGISLWQTEWSMLGDGYDGNEFVGYDKANEMDIALYMSRVIHKDLTVANVTSWSFWTSIDVSRWGQLNRFMLINTEPGDGQYAVSFAKEGKMNDWANLWVLGNYSRFIRPGYKRVANNLSDKETLNYFSSSYVSPNGDEIVVVLTNIDKQSQFLKIGTNTWTPTSVKSYTTTLTKKLEEKDVDPTQEIAIEPSSVTTLVIKL